MTPAPIGVEQIRAALRPHRGHELLPLGGEAGQCVEAHIRCLESTPST
jgi:hypothetical protein